MTISFTNNRVLCGVLCSTLFLASCASNDDYLKATTLPPVVVPDGFDKQALGELYVIPKGDGRLASGELKKPLPPTLSSTQSLTEPRVQTLNGQAWLVVPKEAAATWSQLVLFLRSRRIAIVKQDVFDANIDTSWITDSALPNSALRYQIQLAAGIQPEFTEIHVVNVKGRANDPIPANTVWSERSEDVSHEMWLLKQIAKGISKQKAIGDSLVASSISFAPKVISTSVSGEPVLDLALSEARTYDAITNSLQANDFVIYEESKAEKVIYLNETNKDKKEKKKVFEKLKNFLDRISTAKLTSKGLVTNKSASADLSEILQALPDEDAVNDLFPNRDIVSDAPTLSNVSGYLLVQRNTTDGKQRLYIRSGEGRPLEPSKAKLLLDTIKKQLF
jgi:outer membrane protein assembly factor BamC